MYIYIYIYTHTYTYIYIYMCTYICIYIYIYTYTYMYTYICIDILCCAFVMRYLFMLLQGQKWNNICIFVILLFVHALVCYCVLFGKGQMGSALVGSLRISCFLTEGFVGYSRKPSCIFPKVPGSTFFANPSKFVTSAAAPLVLTPSVRNRDA